MSESPRLSRVARLFLTSQAVAVTGWWVWLWAFPQSRSLFALPEHEAALLAFFIPDILAFVILGLLTSVVPKAARIGTVLITGSAGYSALYCLGYSLGTGSGWLGFGLMSAMATTNAFICMKTFANK